MKASSEKTVSDIDQEPVDNPNDIALEGAGHQEYHFLEQSEEAETQICPSVETQV